MTLCVAALCEQAHPQGAKVVCAVDGMLSHVVSVDVGAPKMTFLGDWVFMFAGQLSNADLMMDDIRPVQFTPMQIKNLVRDAYRKRMAQWSADRFLMQYDMDMQEFKTEGLKMFGDERFPEMSRAIEQDAVNYQEQVLVVGWATSKAKPIFFGMNRDGLASHSLDGLAAIGSGADVALSTLMVLGQRRTSTIEETLYSVSAAKFAAEKCEGVGESTTMFVSWKRTEADPPRPSGHFVQPPQVDKLRTVWNDHGKPRIPPEGWELFSGIATSLYEGKGRQLMLENLNKEQLARKALKKRTKRRSVSQKSKPEQ